MTRKLLSLSKPLQIFQRFIQLESSAGIILFATAILAVILNNSPLESFYQHAIYHPFIVALGAIHFKTSLLFLINDGLMAIFFLVVGLEIKREICLGELNSLGKVMLPGIAAIGGMVVPALIYGFCNRGDSVALEGWAIPTATDIAFALGILSLLGNRMPVSLRLYLMTLAIFDDLGAILIIAFFYQSNLNVVALGGIGLVLLMLWACNRNNVMSLWVYGILGVLLWACFLASGIHPTLAGVLLALMMPIQNKKKSFSHSKMPAYRLEKYLHPWSAYCILPLFAFANAGVSFAELQGKTLLSAIPVGIFLGLFLGKQLGVFISTWAAIQLGFAKMPQGASWWSLYAVAVICGVGFTMSLFIGGLAFDFSYSPWVKFGVLAGSLLSGVVGYLMLLAIKSPSKSHR